MFVEMSPLRGIIAIVGLGLLLVVGIQAVNGNGNDQHYHNNVDAASIRSQHTHVHVDETIPNLIIDTDMDADVDDVGALCMAHALEQQGEVKLVGVVHNMGYPKGVGAISVINHYYGRDDLPIGAYKGEFGATYSGRYVDDLVDNFPSPIKNYTQVPTALEVYRSVLAQQDDASVVISSIGFMTNLRDLLNSGPDKHSNLTGVQLFEKKVRLIAVMGGQYPSSDPQRGEFNFACGNNALSRMELCEGSTNFTYTIIPDTLATVFSGWEVGSKVNSGGVLTTCANASNPCRKAYIDYVGVGKDRSSWDPLTTLFAVRGINAINSTQVGFGSHNQIQVTTGANVWQQGLRKNQSYILLDNDTTATAAIGKSIDTLLCVAPTTKPINY